MHRGRTTAWLRVGALVLIAGSGLVFAARVGVPDLAGVQSAIVSAGPVGVLLFGFAYVVCSLVLVPKGVLSLAAGAVWGLPAGVAIVMVGATTGAVVAFGLGRLLGKDAVDELAGSHVRRLDALVERHGRLSVLVVRLVPLVPFTAVNYVSAVTSVRFLDYLLGTVVGIVPGTVAYVALGAYGTQPASWEFVGAVTALLALTLVGAVVARSQRRAGEGSG